MNGKRKSKITTEELVIDALFIAMTFAFTWLINIRLPLPGTGGLIHLGNLPMFVGAMLFGRRTGALAGGIGMALFDIMSGWGAWAPFTLVIVGCMGYVAGLICEKKPFKSGFACEIMAVLICLVIKVAGYYGAEIVLTGNWLAPVGSIPGNVVQVVFAGVIAIAIVSSLRKVAASVGMRKCS